MTVEARKGRNYLYDRRRIGGRLLGTYNGALTAEEAQVIRQREYTKREILAEEKRAMRAIEAEVASVLTAGAEFDQFADDVFRTSMHLMGYRLHHRGTWRRQRGKITVVKLQDILDAYGPKKPRPALVQPFSEDHEVKALMAKAATGDASVLPLVQERLKTPGWLNSFGSVVSMAESALINQAGGDDVLVREAVRQKLRQNLNRLLGPDPDSVPIPILMAATRVAHCHTTVHILETISARQNIGSGIALAVERQLAMAERRLSIAQKCLATLRRLNRPAINQVNLANGSMQVNNTESIPAIASSPVAPVEK